MGSYVLAFMLLIGGAVFALFGYSNLASTRKKRATWLAVEGTVVDLAEEPGDKGRTLYCPMYRYTSDGKQYTATSKIAAAPPRYKVGDPIALVVDPVRPDHSDVMDGSVHIFTYGLLAAGALLLALGILVAWLAFTGQMKFE